VVALFWAVNAIVTGDWISAVLCAITLAALGLPAGPQAPAPTRG